MPSMPRYLFIAAMCATIYLLFGISTGEEGLHSKIGTGLVLTQMQGDVAYTASLDEIDDNSLFYFQMFKEPYERNFEKLKKWDSKMLDKPYLESWYPEAAGGTNMNGALNQYDRFFSDKKSLAADWEHYYHGSNESWYGHCNGYSASVTRHQEAASSVQRPKGCTPNADPTCVTYTPQDIKALLAEIYMSASSRFLGGKRCEISGENGGLDNINPHTRKDPQIMDECEDVDPGVLHIGLLNWMGGKEQYVIFDQSRDSQVWNYPTYGYSVSYGNNGSRLTAAQAAEMVWGSPLSNYIFNPAAVSFVAVNLTIYYGHVASTPEKGEYRNRTYHYILELDADDNIMGGEWTGTSITNHPDFIWVAFAPYDQPGDAPGTRKLGNYYVKSQSVLELWADSMGFDAQDPINDPKNTRKPLSVPALELNWGNYDPFFNLTLDGRSNGATFLGEKPQLVVTPAAELSGDLQLVLSLNNTEVGTYQVTNSEQVSVALNPQPGMNFLEFVWSADGREIKTAGRTVAFYAM